MLGMRKGWHETAIYTADNSRHADQSEVQSIVVEPEHSPKHGADAQAIPAEECQHRLLRLLDHHRYIGCELWKCAIIQDDMPTDRLGRNADQICCARRCIDRRRRYRIEIDTCHFIQTTTHYIRRVDLRHPTLEVHAAAKRSASTAGRNSIGILYCHEQ